MSEELMLSRFFLCSKSEIKYRINAGRTRVWTKIQIISIL